MRRKEYYHRFGHGCSVFSFWDKSSKKRIHSLTVGKFIKNRDRYLKDGRALEGDGN
jgi:hypothetical protein